MPTTRNRKPRTSARPAERVLAGWAKQIGLDLASGRCCWSQAPSRSRGHWLDRERPSRALRVALQRRRSLACGDCDGASVGLEPRACAPLLVLAIVRIAVVALMVVQAISGAVRGFSDDLPQIVDKVRHSDLGGSSTAGAARSNAAGSTRATSPTVWARCRAASLTSESRPSGPSRSSSRSSS